MVIIAARDDLNAGGQIIRSPTVWNGQNGKSTQHIEGVCQDPIKISCNVFAVYLDRFPRLGVRPYFVARQGRANEGIVAVQNRGQFPIYVICHLIGPGQGVGVGILGALCIEYVVVA